MKGLSYYFIKKLPALLVVASFIISGASCGTTPVYVDDALIGTKLSRAGSKQKVSQLIASSAFNSGPSEEAVFEPGDPTNDDSNGGGRDYVDTNNQVDGVNEGDVIKTDGYQVYYAPRYHNRINVFEVDDNYKINFQREIDLANVYTDSLYLTDDYLVIVGYSYEQFASEGTTRPGSEGDMWIEPYWYQPTGTVLVIDRDDYSIAYQLVTDNIFMDHRMINDALFLVGHRYLYQEQEEFRPSYRENETTTSFVDYDEIYYFDDTLVSGMTVLTGIKLGDTSNDISFSASAYLGAGYAYKQLYVSLDNMYLSETNYNYGEGYSYQTLTISQYELDIEEAKIEYVGATLVRGAMLNQFSMDEYDGYLRVATTDWSATWIPSSDYGYTDYQSSITNHLYILKLNASDGDFDLISHLDEGLGKPNESIQSVRFDGTRAYIVTFLRIDPLYIIDLSTPSNPVFTGEVELPGYDTYQHPWGENRLLGIGYDADQFGLISGIKLSAYNTTSGDASEIQTYELASSINGESSWSNSYSEALWNHKALLVSVDKGIFGFPVNAYEYGYTTSEEPPVDAPRLNGDDQTVPPPPTSDPEVETSEEQPSGEGSEPSNPGEYYEYYWRYHGYYYLFRIDFEKALPIPAPIVIEHKVDGGHYVSVDRAIMIEDYVYTFSSTQVVTYDLSTNSLVAPTLVLNT